MARLSREQRYKQYSVAQDCVIERGLCVSRTIADLVVTTPIKNKAIAAQEAANCLESGGGFYFKTFFFRPKLLELGSRIYYVDDGAIRGFGILSYEQVGIMRCDTSSHVWGDNESYNAILPAHTWHWIKPIYMSGFQGYRYMKRARDTIEIIGDWKTPRPQINSR